MIPPEVWFENLKTILCKEIDKKTVWILYYKYLWGYVLDKKTSHDTQKKPK